MTAPRYRPRYSARYGLRYSDSYTDKYKYRYNARYGFPQSLWRWITDPEPSAVNQPPTCSCTAGSAERRCTRCGSNSAPTDGRMQVAGSRVVLTSRGCICTCDSA